MIYNYTWKKDTVDYYFDNLRALLVYKSRRPVDVALITKFTARRIEREASHDDVPILELRDHADGRSVAHNAHPAVRELRLLAAPLASALPQP